MIAVLSPSPVFLSLHRRLAGLRCWENEFPSVAHYDDDAAVCPLEVSDGLAERGVGELADVGGRVILHDLCVLFGGGAGVTPALDFPSRASPCNSPSLRRMSARSWLPHRTSSAPSARHHRPAR